LGVFKLKRIIKSLIIAGVIFSLAGITGCGTTNKTGEKAEAKSTAKVLKVGTEASFAPFEYVEEGTSRILGFDAELMQAIGDTIGYKVELINTGWDGLIPGVQNGNIDAVIAAMTITEERSKEVTFSEPYFKAVQYIAIKEGSSYKKPEDLVGKKIGVQINTTGHFAAEKIPGVKKEDIKTFDTAPTALTELINGGVEAVITDSPVLLDFIKKNSNAKVTFIDPKLPSEDHYGIAMKKENTKLHQAINEGLKKVKESGKYDAIYKKYFGDNK
jgi:ABC-type amino acid transport substrate-binding protein